MTSFRLTVEKAVKTYGGVTALADGNLDVQAGTVTALLGANGSGKSTLSKILTGVVSPNSGSITLNGAPMRFASPQAARQAGISAVYQELSLIPDLTVAENIWLAHEPLKNGFVSRTLMRQRTQSLLDLFAGLYNRHLTPDALITDLTPDERQLVEILKALSFDPRLIILDEATASLDGQQVNRLFELVTQWKANGMAIVMVSHRMEEIFRIADKASVLRNGRTVGERVIAETSERELVELMIEGAGALHRERAPLVDPANPVRLEVRGLKTSVLHGVDLTVRDGELLGLGGLQGQGQSDLLMALFGAIRSTGQMIVSGEARHFRHPRQAMAADVALVPGDRGSEGLLLIRSIFENLILPSWGSYGTPIRVARAREKGAVIAEELKMVMSSLDAPVNSLSGGNAQKVVIGKWLLRAPKLLLLNDPTKGIDVGAKAEFYSLLRQLRDRGTAILFYSSDDDELLGLCNRVLVMHDGRVSTELFGDRLTHEQLVSASMGTPS
ncbi:MAG: sugar ABC transporter ATP-binding protein [Pleurocapsa minor GSE-CHR-MK-17-07R]|jgi:ribose transport system ATP-binding protein|nr:sugar ABC transporter ATP-binding protein [Pleurocapsa minor GSE-CHR-MK 17-07R]